MNLLADSLGHIIVTITLLEPKTGKMQTVSNTLDHWLEEDDGGTAGIEQAYEEAGRDHYDEPDAGHRFEIVGIETNA